VLEPRNYLEVLYLLPRFNTYRNSGGLEAYVQANFIGYCSQLCKGAYKASAMVVFEAQLLSQLPKGHREDQMRPSRACLIFFFPAYVINM